MTNTTQPVAPVTQRTWIDIAVVLVLSAIGMIGFGTAFDSVNYLIAGLGGLVIGGAAAYVAYRLGFGALLTAAVAVVAYYLFGSPIALFGDALFGVLPTLGTLASLSVGAVFGWADIMTLRAPVSLPDYVTAVPYLSGWIVALVSVTLALRWLPRRPRVAWRSGILLIGPAVLYLGGVLLGTDEPYFAAIRGITFAVVALIWLGWRRRDGAQVALNDGGAMLRRKVLGTVAVVGTAALLGGVVGSLVAPAPENRFVLREQIEPPFEPLNYPSPLAGFREYTKDLVDTTVFTVDGLEAGQRIRLATMDTYNGVIWGVAGAEQATDASGSFRLVGRTIPDPPLFSTNSSVSLDVTIGAYDDVWIPDAGYADSITLSDADKKFAQDVRYNDATGTAVLTSGLSEGASYTLEASLQSLPSPEQLVDVPVASITPSSVSNTPDPVIARATEIANTATTPYAKLQAIEQYLATTGFLSHGTASDQAPSRAGHGADRMYDMVTLPTMVGDEEQYASLFALMARSFNYPVRVVMGFAPEVTGDGPIAVTGDDVTAWPEVAFEGVGWIPFYPTPDETDVPQDQVPKPKTEPQPQVRQPPRTDTEQDDLVTAVEIDDSDDDEEDPPFVVPTWVYILGIVLAVPLVFLLVPLLIIAGIKARRLRRRRAAPRGDTATAGAWDELLDRYSELGYTVPTRTTRTHVASGLEEQVGTTEAGLGNIALRTDNAVFSGRTVGEDETEQVWTEAMAAVQVARASATRGRRILSRFRISSVRAWAARVARTAEAEAGGSGKAPGTPRTRRSPRP
jgi:transglutaminase-like putative cysteine protease